MPAHDNSGKNQHADCLSQGGARNLEIIGQISLVWQALASAPSPFKDRKPHAFRNLDHERLPVQWAQPFCWPILYHLVFCHAQPVCVAVSIVEGRIA